MGQPAACMMDSKSLSAQMGQSAIMAQRGGHCVPVTLSRHAPLPPPTKSVDNFVGTPIRSPREAGQSVLATD